MKKRLLLLSISLIVFKNFVAQTNVYHPFPDSNAVWHQHEHTSTGSDTHWQYGIIGDTVINALTWHKIYSEPNCIPDPVITVFNSSLIGAIREDSLKRVFFYNMNYWTGTQDSIYKLYDFSAQAGDTVFFGPLSYTTPYVIIDSTDSVFIYNQYRKRFHINMFNETWVEGIGNMRSLFSILDPYPTCSCLLELFCFRQNDTSFYIKSPFLDCYDLTADVAESGSQIHSANISPNPFSTETTFSTTEKLNNATLTIYNSFGQVVKQAKNISGQSMVLQRDNLPDGIYFLRLSQGNKFFEVKKFVISGN